MLSKSITRSLKQQVTKKSLSKAIAPSIARSLATSTPPSPSDGLKPSHVYTKLSHTDDPARSRFFQYSWGSWLKDDALKKKQRETIFSIEGLTAYLNSVDSLRVPETAKLLQPKEEQGTFVLQNNLTFDVLGAKSDVLLIKSISSIHEGKHHRIYKLTLSTGKDLVLRIPYKLESDTAIASKIKSEVATSDFLKLKLGLDVPKIIAYGPDRNNAIRSPFILQEFIEGELLMKKWNPLEPDSDKTDEDLKSVIAPIAEFQDKILEPVFTKFGSLYFYNDVTTELQQNGEPYEGENDEKLLKRWRVGPSVEKAFTKGKNKLSQDVIDQYNGPWDASNPEQVMTSVAEIEIENARNKLAIVDADAGDVTSKDLLQHQITTFEHLKQITPKLLNSKSPSIKNVEELFKPRLYVPDLDPLNVIQSTEGKNYFIDFEGSTIKPFILSSYPKFVEYQGAKIYDLKVDIPGFDEMDPVEKQQYEFMYYKTRNERLWEVELNKHRHDLIAVASPHIKVLKSPYLQALDLKHSKDYLYVEGAIVQLQSMWEAYVANELVKQDKDDKEFPIKYDEKYLDQYQLDLSDHQMETVSSPFSATGGWIPQDMFRTLKEQGILVEVGEGNYEIKTDKILENPPSETGEEPKA
ncbi:conserved hypothetical protein [Lodderomyces elongisporus NRRL YB-4239]|uniref:Altered inheritance of mitochondria protein 9, mitochondrial n=1 Tax=Lodderomyces elongisporus (strain ATCC 11503 / CBS 2605 / JCM 1781 / NBRC 1676 / NRRL YB-4239) TaxID=379508 RepID=AIM9_LODEL|nr:RecName: Full=Altered inheritance of mitochondria protein 9, mitochondrial; AltName: Full=Found in mitochondrial proteome protein 29; Flags: Precursor [Lodderomyces elongisporus NRRL YB-4239]EDK43221.1 conserved hypothetical protein [Lodderomyces elongisporus NRRL YB-4239]